MGMDSDHVDLRVGNDMRIDTKKATGGENDGQERRFAPGGES